jgi:hypothetical protein
LTARTPHGSLLVLAIKAGHNDENHNHNDIGSFILHGDGETLLADPGRGLYTRDYFNRRRYENVFANSYSHSVPRIGGALQREGREFHGEFVSVETDSTPKWVEIEFARAYGVTDLTSARRQIMVDPDGRVTLLDHFRFSASPVEIEEALVTWCNVQVDGATARIRAERHALRLTIESPGGARFGLERLEKESQENGKTEVLKRLSVLLPVQRETVLRMEMVEDA